MTKFSDQVVDKQYNQPIANCQIFVYDSTGALATLTTDAGTAMTNPFNADSFGFYSFNVAVDAVYRIEYWSGGKMIYAQQVIIGSPAAFKGTTGLTGEAGAPGATGPIGQSILQRSLVGYGPPAATLGAIGDNYVDAYGQQAYGPKTASGWGTPTALSVLTNQPTFTVYDFVNQALPSGIACTRAQPTTDLLYSDTTRTTYTTFAANTVAVHPINGILNYQYSRQYAPTPVAPANGSFTVTTLAVGPAFVKLWGAGTITSAAAGTTPATATGYATTDKTSFQTLNITATGGITFTIAGADATTLVQVEQSDALPGKSTPTPFMPTTGARAGDSITLGGVFLSAFQASTGTAIIDAVIPYFNNGYQYTILGINGSSSLFTAATSGLTYYDGAANNTTTIGNETIAGGFTATLAWKAGRTAYGGGDRYPLSVAANIWNNVAITSMKLGAPGTGDTYGQQGLNGGIKRIQLSTVTLTDNQLFDRYTTRQRPTTQQMVPAYISTERFAETKARLAQMIGGAVNYVPFVFPGNSGVAGVPVRTSSFVYKLAKRLRARGMPVYTNHFAGLNNTGTFSGGTASYDARVSYTGAVTAGSGGLGIGGPLVRIPSGATLTITFEDALTNLQVSMFPGSTGDGSGSFSVSAGGGAAIVPDGGGATATPTLTNTNAFVVKTFTAASNTVWTITASGGSLSLDQIIDITPGRIQFVIAGLSSYNASDLTSDGTILSQNSYWGAIRELNPSLLWDMPDNTNSAVAPLTLTNYRAAVKSQLDKAQAIPNCDVAAMTNQRVSTSVISENLDRQYARLLVAEALTRPAVFSVHYRQWSDAYTWAQLNAQGYYYDTLHYNATGADLLAAAPLEPVFADMWTSAGGTVTALVP
jgi:hypothetical protein